MLAHLPRKGQDMSKAKINLVEVRSDHSVIVYYESGITRPFKNMDMLPKTAKAWLDSHKAPESVKATATAEGVQIQTAQETMPEPLETSIEAVETTEPIDCNFILIDAPVEAVEATEHSRPVKCPPCAVEIKTEPITATETEVSEPIRMDTTHAMHRTASRIKGKASAAANTVRTAVRRAQKGINRVLEIISAETRKTAKTARNKATQQAFYTKAWWRASWEFRRQLVEAETILG